MSSFPLLFILLLRIKMLGARGEIIVSATHSLVVERSIIKFII